MEKGKSLQYIIEEIIQNGFNLPLINFYTYILNLLSIGSMLEIKNISHRDIKPDNILECQYKVVSKLLKLADFGIGIDYNEKT